ncbi:MAG: hypothetical protein U9Q67_04245, partial [Patescibacteria group bacterium]|nr:hypothetical protein [Patescibacteria group bacterium]
MNLKKLLAKYWSIILLTLIVSTIIVSNLDPNRIIMGLDNASPYFSSEPLISKMHGTSLFIYGSLIFTMPFFSLLRLVNLSPEIQ